MLYRNCITALIVVVVSRFWTLGLWVVLVFIHKFGIAMVGTDTIPRPYDSEPYPRVDLYYGRGLLRQLYSFVEIDTL